VTARVGHLSISIGAVNCRIQSETFHDNMPVFLRFSRTAALIVSLCALPSVCAAQSNQPLRTATMAASAAAAADWASTYHALKFFRVRESNPLLRPFDESPGPMVTLGAAIDVGAVSAWNLTMGREHPKVAVAGLWAMTAFRSYLAFHNIRNEHRSGRR
jgi:hypothetical protein